jgi:hypothetical protein
VLPRGKEFKWDPVRGWYLVLLSLWIYVDRRWIKFLAEMAAMEEELCLGAQQSG